VRAGLDRTPVAGRSRRRPLRVTGWLVALGLAGAGGYFVSQDGDRDPWQARGIPQPLAAIHADVMSGGGLDREEQRVLNTSAREHARDPRPVLLLAHGFANQGWRKDAILRYLKAFELDSAARHDPRVLTSLLALVDSDTHGQDACDAIATIYGAAAVPAVERAIGALPAGTQRSRLQALRQKLSR
jgi:hypothetical protein